MRDMFSLYTYRRTALGISERQACRLLARYQENGGFGLVHKARGRALNRSRNPGVRKFAVELVKTHYADFGPTLAVEALAGYKTRRGRPEAPVAAYGSPPHIAAQDGPLKLCL